MEPVIPPETRALFEAAVSGAFEFFDLLVLTRPYAQLYYYLKEVYRWGRAPKLPPLHMYDLMPSRREAVRTYNWKQTETLIARLEHLGGSEITDSALVNAIELTNPRAGSSVDCWTLAGRGCCQASTRSRRLAPATSWIRAPMPTPSRAICRNLRR